MTAACGYRACARWDVLPMASSEHLGLRVDVHRGEDASVTVSLAGEFDLASAELARNAVQQLGPGTKQIVLDLSGVTFFSAAGVRFVLAARARASAVGGELILHQASSAVRQVFELTGVLPLICAGEPGGMARRAALDPEVVSICDAVVASAIRASGAAMGNAQVVDPATGALRIVAQHGFRRPFLDFFQTVRDEDSACGAALAAGQPVWVSYVATSEVFAGTPALDVMLEAGSQAVASVPVLGSDGSVIAMISTHHRQPTTWTDDQKRQLEALAASTGWLLSA